MNKEYDLAVVYRIYPGVSKVPIIYENNKFELSKIAIKTFAEALGDMKVKVWIILDNCSEEYDKLFITALKKFDIELIKLNGEGGYSTFNKQIEILLNQDIADIVYLAEDDYIFLPNSLQDAVKFMRSDNSVDFLTIYDSLDYYKMKLHEYDSKIKYFGNRHWRTVSCTTLSFMTRKSNLYDTKIIFDTYSNKNNFDSSLWMSLTKINLFQFSSIFRFINNNDRDFIRIIKAWIYCWKQIIFGKKYTLWSPIPSLGTHLDDQGIAPVIDWEKTIKGDGK